MEDTIAAISTPFGEGGSVLSDERLFNGENTG